MDKQYSVDEVAERLKPALDFYKSLDYQAKGKLFGTTASSDIDNILALAVLMSDGKVVPQINLDELAKRIEVGVVPEIDLEKLADAVAARVKLSGAAPEVDYNKLVDMVAERVGQAQGNVPYVTVSYQDWSIDHPEDIPGDVRLISDYLKSKGWEPDSCVMIDEKTPFEGNLKITQEEIVNQYEDEEAFSLYFKKNNSILKVDIFPIDENVHFYLTDYFPDFKQGVDDLEDDSFLAPKTKNKLAKTLTGLAEKFLDDDFDPEENTTETDEIEILEMADRLGPKEV